MLVQRSSPLCVAGALAVSLAAAACGSSALAEPDPALRAALAAGGAEPEPTAIDRLANVGWDPSPGLRRDRQGLIACATPGAVDEQGGPITCELSAAATTEGGVLVFNDKPGLAPLHTSAFVVDPTADAVVPRGLDEPTIASFRKWEDAEPWSNGQVLVTTGFDRIRSGDATWDGFNGLLLWRPGGAPRIIAASAREGVTSSRRLRQRFAAALADDRYPSGPPYFKIEGLAGLPDGRVLFGVRETGSTWKDFRFTMIVLAGRDLESLGDEDITRLWAFDPTADARIEHPLGLSSMTWDRSRGGLWLTSSWETGETPEDLGGYLWWLTPRALDTGAAPHLVTDDHGAPVVFAHKPEGVTVLSDGRLLIVHDDDRVASADPAPSRPWRALHESAFEILAPL